MAKQRTVVLAVRSSDDREALRPFFEREGNWRILTPRTEEALWLVAEKKAHSIDLLVAEAGLLTGKGLDAVRRLQAGAGVDGPPLVILSPAGAGPVGYPSDDLSLVEYLNSPIQPEVAWRRLRNVAELHEYQKRDASYQHTISRDPLLGFLSGGAMIDAVNRALPPEKGERSLLAHINVDDMRPINERCGYHFGDQALVDVAASLAKALPEATVIARPYGDTFCALLPCPGDPLDRVRRLEDLKSALRRTYPDAPGAPVTVTACIGVASAPENGATFQTLFEAAETALDVAKQMGRDNLVFYDPAMRAASRARRGARYGSWGEETAPLADRYAPVLSGKDGSLQGYDYYALPAGEENQALPEALDLALRIQPQACLLRAQVRQFFSSLHAMKGEGPIPPAISFCAALPAEEASLLPHALQESLARFPIDAGRVCVNLPQGMVVQLNRHRLESLVGDIRALGFGVGIHQVGEHFLPNVCFDGKLFDRILFSPSFTRDLLSGAHPPSMLEDVLASMATENTVLCFPVPLSKADRGGAAAILRDAFCYYGDALLPREAFLAQAQKRQQPEKPQEFFEKTFSFRIGAEQYNEIFEKSSIVVFDWHPHTNMIFFSETFETVFGFQVDTVHLSDALLSRMMHEEDVPRLRDALLQAKHGKPYVEGVMRALRLRDGQRVQHWRRYSLIAVSNEKGVVQHVFGISLDIDREHREIQDFKKRAETDPLTQIYNRGATEQHIKSFLADEGKEGAHALMLLDIDDFKAINDTLGHLTGDEVLQYLARKLSGLFRRDDVVGRIGGDEFMVFVKHVSSEALIAAKADAICQMMRAADPKWNLSGSLGIARYPQDGHSYQALFRHADDALYSAKHVGKDRYMFYAPGLEGKKPETE